MKTVLSFLLVWLVLFSGCSQSGTTAVGTQTSQVEGPKSEVTSNKEPESQTSAALQNQIQAIAAQARGRVGVLAVILETGEVVASLEPRRHFPMQSVYKLPISMAVMKEVDAGKLRLDQKVRVAKSDLVGSNMHSPIRDRHRQGVDLSINELIRYAIAESDGTASDVLLRVAGGGSAVRTCLTGLGIKDMIVLNTEKELGEDWQAQYRNSSSPEASVALLRALHERRGMSEPSQTVLLKYLIESKPGAKRLKGILPASTTVAHKTGTSGTRNGVTAATNDIGIITLPNGKHLAIAVFVSDSPADLSTREEVIAKIAKAIYDAASGQ